jgi:hypothetical protein
LLWWLLTQTPVMAGVAFVMLCSVLRRIFNGGCRIIGLIVDLAQLAREMVNKSDATGFLDEAEVT